MTNQQKQSASSIITEQQVADFLHDNTDFFANHPDLLAEINLPHESGKAVSLVERQVAVLRENNMDMRHRLSKLLDNARDNSKLFDKTRRLTLMLLESQHLKDVVDSVFFSFENDFTIPYTELILFANPQQVGETRARTVSVHDARQGAARLLKSGNALCGDFANNELAFLFGNEAENIRSAAVVPLIHGGSYGLLAVGSNDPHHYRSSMGTLFISYMGEIISRVLPRHLNVA